MINSLLVISQKLLLQSLIMGVFFNWVIVVVMLSSHYEAWSYKKKKHKKIRLLEEREEKNLSLDIFR